MSGDQLVQLDGEELLKAADDARYQFYGDECPYTAEQLILIASKLGKAVHEWRPVTNHEESDNSFSDFFEQACIKANDQQLDRLIEIYARLEPASFYKSFVLPALANRWIRREVKTIRSKPSRVRLSGLKVKAPPEIERLPPRLIAAWKLYRRVLNPYEKWLPKDSKEKIDAFANEKTFYCLVTASFTGDTKGIDSSLAGYVQGGANCLGITDISDAKDIAFLTILLRQRRLDEAIGAALQVVGTNGSTSSPKKIAGSIVELFEACGVDWETICAGAQVDQEVKGWAFGRRNPYLDMLGTYGSDRAASLLNQMARLAKPELRPAYADVLNSLVGALPTARTCEGSAVDLGSSAEKRVASPIPYKVQLKSLSILESFATSDCPEEIAFRAVNVFSRTQLPSSIPALRRLANHSSAEVAEIARLVLCAMGQETPQQRNEKVRFQILVNEEPVKDLRVWWNVFWADGNRTSSSIETDAEGIMGLEGKYFAKPNDPPSKVSFSSLNEESGVIFDKEVPVPSNLDSITTIKIDASRLEIRLQNLDRLNISNPGKARIELRPHRSDEEAQLLGEYFQAKETTIQGSVVISSVENGTYDIWLSVEGAAIWRGAVVVRPSGTVVDAALKPGSDLRFDVVMPDGRHSNWAPIFKEGKALNIKPDFHSGVYRGLACGKYQLRIPSSDWILEYRAKEKIRAGPDEIAFAGREVPFTIEPGSPAVIDLGEIHLDPK